MPFNLTRFHVLYPKNDLNVHDITSTKLKFVLSTNSSTRIFTIQRDPLGIPFQGVSPSYFVFFLLLKVCSGFRQKKTKSYHLKKKRNMEYFFFLPSSQRLKKKKFGIFLFFLPNLVCLLFFNISWYIKKKRYANFLLIYHDILTKKVSRRREG